MIIFNECIDDMLVFGNKCVILRFEKSLLNAAFLNVKTENSFLAQMISRTNVNSKDFNHDLHLEAIN